MYVSNYFYLCTAYVSPFTPLSIYLSIHSFIQARIEQGGRGGVRRPRPERALVRVCHVVSCMYILLCSMLYELYIDVY